MSSVVKIKIDGVQMDTDRQTEVVIAAAFNSLMVNDEPNRQVDRFSLPATTANRKVMGFAEQMASEPLNAVEHQCEIVIDDRVVVRGEPLLHSIERGANGVRYNIEVKVDNPSWRKRVAQKGIAELSFDYQAKIDSQAVADSWTQEQAVVRFLPVCRKAVNTELTGAELDEVTKPLAADDYHPFLHLRSVVERIFGDAGYAVESEFMAGDEFDSLYMSGGYPEGNVAELERYMGFCARRNNSATATADYSGCVYASPIYSSHTVGNLVDLDTSEKFDDTYNKNRCLQLINGRLAWRPTRQVSVGFVYELKYRTDCRIKSRHRLAGFDKIWLDGATCHSFSIANPYVDHRDNPTGGFNYRIVAFEAAETDTFRLVYQIGGVQQLSEVFVGGSGEVVLGQVGDVPEIVRLEVMGNGGSFTEWTEDWALYSGYIEENPTVDVAVTLRSTPQTVTPNKPKYLDRVVFGGADEGMSLRVESGVCIHPVFYAYTVEGADVGWADVAAIECGQAEVVDAVCGMFNLKVMEDSAKKRVRIEPVETLLSRAKTVDWCGVIGQHTPLEVKPLALTLPQNLRLSYQSGDAAVEEFNQMTKQEFGTWSVAIVETGSPTEQADITRVVFTPSIGVKGCFVEAPEAEVIKVGSLHADSMPTLERLNFPVKVARYFGTQKLTDGTLWGWPTYGEEYPYAAFHDPEREFTLCFEDRDGVKGLNKHYTRTARLWNTTKQITVRMALAPHQVAELMDYAAEHDPTERLYLLGVDSENDLYTLDGIEDFTPDTATVKCRFTKIK